MVVVFLGLTDRSGKPLASDFRNIRVRKNSSSDDADEIGKVKPCRSSEIDLEFALMLILVGLRNIVEYVFLQKTFFKSQFSTNFFL